MKDEPQSIFKLAEKLQSLQQDAVKQTLAFYDQEVEDILLNKISDKPRIEQALDQLLEVAFDGRVLKLFKNLCRHYYFIDPHATTSYVEGYREMWDEESFEEGRKQDSASPDGVEGVGYGE